MNIGAFQKTTLLDFPGKIACIVFTQGCNLRCFYCYNKKLLSTETKGDISEKEVLNFLKDRVGKLEGVVITGGEPTIQKDLKDFIKKIRSLGFLVKLDTNGTNPNLLKELLEEKLLDYVAMDIKGPLTKYKEITKTDTIIEDIKKSIETVLNSNVKHEFRTVKIASLTPSDFKDIEKLIGSKSKYFKNELLDVQNDF